VGEPPVFAVGPASDRPDCLVEQAVNAALSDAFEEAEKLLLKRISAVTLADIALDFDLRLAQHPKWAERLGADCRS
jgi:hypothetical protein